MKTVAFIAIALVLGFLLGGIGPRRELADEKDKLADAERALDAAKHEARNHGRVLPLPIFDDLPQRGDAPPSKPRTMPGVSVSTHGDEDDKGDDDEGKDGDKHHAPPTREEMLQQFDAAADLQKARVAQLEAALKEKGVDDQQLASANDVIAKMNEQLSQDASQVLTVLEAGGQPDPATMLSMTHDVSGVLLDAQQQFQQSMGASWQNLDPSAQQVWNYVDLGSMRGAFEQAVNDGKLAPPPPHAGNH